MLQDIIACRTIVAKHVPEIFSSFSNLLVRTKLRRVQSSNYKVGKSGKWLLNTESADTRSKPPMVKNDHLKVSTEVTRWF